MATETERSWSNLAIPPGELLQEELDAIGMTQQELASRIRRPPQVVNEIIRGKKAITHETALQLEMVLGVPAHIWVNLESSYRMALAKTQELHQLERGQQRNLNMQIGLEQFFFHLQDKLAYAQEEVRGEK